MSRDISGGQGSIVGALGQEPNKRSIEKIAQMFIKKELPADEYLEYIASSVRYFNFWNSDEMEKARSEALLEGISLPRYLREVVPDLYITYINNIEELHKSLVSLINKIGS